MAPSDCDKYPTCNASICPIDPRWLSAAHLTGEPACTYLLASGKAGAADYHADRPAFAAVLGVVPAVLARHPDIARRVALAAGSGFRGANLRPRRRLATRCSEGNSTEPTSAPCVPIASHHSHR
jgi:hypothetical protein